MPRDGGIHQRAQHGDVEQVGAQRRDRAGPQRIELEGQVLRLLRRAMVVDHHLRAGRVELARDGVCSIMEAYDGG